MLRPPRSPSERLFSPQTVLVAITQGIAFVASCLVIFWTHYGKVSDATVRSLTFECLAIGILGIISINRSWSKSIYETIGNTNTGYRNVIPGTVALQGLTLRTTSGRHLLHFDEASLVDQFFAIATPLAIVGVFGALKFFPATRKLLLSHR